jgi:hypothetical protein
MSHERAVPLPIASRVTTALRSGDLGSPVLVWSHPRKGGGSRKFVLTHFTRRLQMHKRQSRGCSRKRCQADLVNAQPSK